MGGRAYLTKMVCPRKTLPYVVIFHFLNHYGHATIFVSIVNYYGSLKSSCSMDFTYKAKQYLKSRRLTNFRCRNRAKVDHHRMLKINHSVTKSF